MMMEGEMVNMEEHTVVIEKEASSIFKKSNRLVTLKFEDVVYKVIPKKEGVLNHSKGEEKVILKGTNGMVKPGEMLAMLGPSGSGKTTLLTALGGRLSGRLSGSITYNGSPFSSAIKRNMGFVTQDDVLYPSLTVTETLVFTALLRLPNSLTKQEKTAHAEAVIDQLGLAKCKNSIVGGGFVRGVSGGERKRVSIGQEMLINPSLLLLDEPTSGLDSTTAQRIVSTLWELANGGKTIVMTIHQPSSRVFYMFHKVLLLSEGNMIYFGNGAEAMDYFASVGYAPSVAMNPADFLLDLANGISTDNGQEDQAVVKSDLVSAFKANLAGNLKASLRENFNSHHTVQEDKQSGKWATTWWQQFTVLIRRGLKERSHETFSPLRIVQVLVVAVLAGLLWWRSTTAHLQDQIGLLFFYTGFWGFYPAFQALFTFPPERKILEKERSSGMYRLSSYFAARTFGDLPMELVLPTAFVTITYFMGGLKIAASNYFKTLFSVLLSVLTAQSFGLAIGALVMDTKSASTLASVLMLAFQLAGGYMVSNVPAFISWIKYISFTQFTYKLLLASQYKADEMYPCNHNSTCLVGDFPSVKMIGLGQEGISVVALVVMAVVYRLIAYLALMRIGVTKN